MPRSKNINGEQHREYHLPDFSVQVWTEGKEYEVIAMSISRVMTACSFSPQQL